MSPEPVTQPEAPMSPQQPPSPQGSTKGQQALEDIEQVILLDSITAGFKETQRQNVARKKDTPSSMMTIVNHAEEEVVPPALEVDVGSPGTRQMTYRDSSAVMSPTETNSSIQHSPRSGLVISSGHIMPSPGSSYWSDGDSNINPPGSLLTGPSQNPVPVGNRMAMELVEKIAASGMGADLGFSQGTMESPAGNEGGWPPRDDSRRMRSMAAAYLNHLSNNEVSIVWFPLNNNSFSFFFFFSNLPIS